MIGDLHQLFKAGLRDEDTYPKLKKVLLQRALNSVMGSVFNDKI